MSRFAVNESTRRRLGAKQADTVQRLTAAAVEELRETDYANLSVRNVAAVAGVSPATAYTYFSSKNHLVAEVFWRRLSAPEFAVDADMPTKDRVVEVLRGISMLVSDEPELAAACTSALLGTDPDVQHLRVRIGVEIRQRIEAALGEGHDPAVANALELAWSGAMVQAGMGYLSYSGVADRLTEAAELIME